jgi:hypothetical protein
VEGGVVCGGRTARAIRGQRDATPLDAVLPTVGGMRMVAIGHHGQRGPVLSSFGAALAIPLYLTGPWGRLSQIRPGPRPEIPQKFRFSADLFGLTDVFFNSNRTLALAGFSAFCGPLCGRFSWVAFAKAGGKWEQLPWSACSVFN